MRSVIKAVADIKPGDIIHPLTLDIVISVGNLYLSDGQDWRVVRSYNGEQQRRAETMTVYLKPWE